MSNIGLDFGPEDDGEQTPAHSEPAQAPLPRAGSRRAETTRRRGPRGCVPLVLVLVVVAVGIYFGGGWAIDKVKSLTGSSPDYSASDTSKETVLVELSGTAADIGRTLKAKGVVKSVDAFTKAAADNKDSEGIQAATYLMHLKMPAADAVAFLVNHDNIFKPHPCSKASPPCALVIPEGFRLTQIVDRLVKQAHLPRAQVKAAIKPGALKLPADAHGDAEGYLAPATYIVLPNSTASQLVGQMYAKTQAVEASLGIAAKAKKLGLTVHQVLTVASILEYEASRDQDYPKVARAIYNRLKIGMALQSDATVAYANNLTGTLYTTDAQRAIDSPYNTYKNTGLPPGPIGAAGEKTIRAALNPTPGPWLYWVVVNLKTGETRFNTTYEGHQQDVALFHQYCQTSDAC